MRFPLARCALVALTVVGLSGCKSGGGLGMPGLKNPFAKASHDNGYPEKPTASATPTSPKAGYAAATADTLAPAYGGSSGSTASYRNAPGYQDPQSASYNTAGAAAGYGTPGNPSASGGSYLAPQAGRYDTGGYGSPSYTASRNSAASYSAGGAGGYAPADSYGHYGSSASGGSRYGSAADRSSASGTSADNYRAGSYGAASRYGNSSLAATGSDRYDRSSYANSYASRDTESASRYGTGSDPRYASDPRYGSDAQYQSDARYRSDSGNGSDPRYGSGSGSDSGYGAASRYGDATGSRGSATSSYGAGSPSSRAAVTDPYAATSASRYGDNSSTRPWNRTLDRAADSGRATGSYTPGDTNYRPGDTGYAPGDTGYTPPNTPKYQSPAAPYSPTGAGSSETPEFRPGSVRSYTPRATSMSPAMASLPADAAGSNGEVDADVTPTGYSQPAKGSW